ncbi:hypothetical protein B0H63DRAFT_66272 [Podospora didyma]|uniref:Uncharacterized protein n=1 Tax=Podospora didyma TaxID=330526 RepID=A0AAE0P8I5_9PEZI|nr:hypothetical protein B0H63DRAFT_66272 [Podospora didyma]
MDATGRRSTYGFGCLGAVSPDIVRQLQDPSNQALLQGLLRLAVEEGDVPLARTLLHAGADPNTNTCMHEDKDEGYLFLLRPLQYSCLKGNLEMVKELLRAKAQIDHPESGWSCSPLLFAIIGYFEGSWWGRPLAEDATTKVAGTVSDSNHDNIHNITKSSPKQEGFQVEDLLTLIRELLTAGADVNAIGENPNDMGYTLETAHPSDIWYPLVGQKHTALTLGSSFRCPELVDFLISKDADIRLYSLPCQRVLVSTSEMSLHLFRAPGPWL